MSGMESFEALVSILGDGKATAAKLATLKAAAEEARQAKAAAEKAQDDLAAERHQLGVEREKWDNHTRAADAEHAKRTTALEAQQVRLDKLTAEAETNVARSKEIRLAAEQKWKAFSA